MALRGARSGIRFGIGIGARPRVPLVIASSGSEQLVRSFSCRQRNTYINQFIHLVNGKEGLVLTVLGRSFWKFLLIIPKITFKKTCRSHNWDRGMHTQEMQQIHSRYLWRRKDNRSGIRQLAHSERGRQIQAQSGLHGVLEIISSIFIRFFFF